MGDTRQPVHLLYGANRPDEFFAQGQLDGYVAKGLSLTVERAVVDGESSCNLATGHVTDLLRPDLLSGGACRVYLCGPPPMIEAAEGWLSSNGVPATKVHAEKFVPS